MNRFRTWNLFWLFATLSSSGCVSTSIVDPDYSLDRAHGKALVLLSISETGGRQFPSLVYRKRESDDGGQFKSFKPAYDAPIARAAATNQSDFADVKGSLLLVELDPGDYEIYRWRVDAANGYWYRDGLNYRFRARAGELTYIGNFHMNHSEGRALYLQDRQERDVARFRQMFAKLRAVPVERSKSVGNTASGGVEGRGHTRIEDLLGVLLPDSEVQSKP